MMKSTIAALMVAATTACSNEWIWEECSWMYYREGCGDEVTGDGDPGDGCGWIYWYDWEGVEKEVTCDQFDKWSACWE